MVGISIPTYERFAVGRARVVATHACAASIRTVLGNERLYDYAARQPDAVPLVGRAPVFAVNLPGACGRVVVRHNMRGGWMAKLSDDVFVFPTRGFRELIASLRLRALAFGGERRRRYREGARFLASGDVRSLLQ